MEIYLAGGATGNNIKIWKDNAETNPTKPMEVFLAGTNAEQNQANAEGDFAQKISILESFYYIKDWMRPYIQNHWDFLLDSGAFTFLMISKKQHQNVDWDAYLNRYAEFINENKIEHFIELDIEGIVGMEKMESMRKDLERMTGKQSIPVFHKERGKDYWLGMVRDYGYVALGGLTNLHKKTDQIPESMFPWFLQTAKEQDCKVHGLGYTSIKGMQKYKFHSVDSTAWLYGNRGGFLYYFNGIELVKEDKPKGTRLKAREVAVHNFREWVKFQKYAKTNL